MLFDQAFIQNLALFFTSFYKVNSFSLDEMIWKSERKNLAVIDTDVLANLYIVFSYLRNW